MQTTLVGVPSASRCIEVALSLALASQMEPPHRRVVKSGPDRADYWERV